MSLGILSLLAYLYFGSARIGLAESILKANWGELSEETQKKIVRNQYIHMGLALLMILFVSLDLMALAPVLEAGMQALQVGQ